MSERVGLEGVLDLSQFTGNLSVYVNGVNKMTSETVRASSTITQAGGGLNVFREISVGALRAVGEAALEWMAKAGAAVANFTGEIVAGALEDEQTLTRLSQTIKSTGGVAGITSGEALDLAGSFHILAGGSDDAVLSLIQIGLQLGTISEEEMPAFIQTSLDLGAVMGSATEAARLLAFAQEQPTQALRRFRQANILFTDSQIAQIKTMEEAGDTAGAFAVIMAQVSSATSGAAQSQLDTLSGKFGLFKTVVAESGEAIMGAFVPAAHALFDATLAPAIPIIESLSGAFAEMITQIISGDAAAGFDTFRESVRASLGETAANAVTWGSNIVISLANGIIDGIGYVIDALASVGDVIAYWLAPGSPPRLLPDLDTWGSDALGEYLGGWTQGDFSAFSDISKTIEGFLRSLPVGDKDKGGIIQSILGSRDAIAQAINDVREFGAVSEETFQSIVSAVGASSPELEAYIRTMLELEGANALVADAQSELTEAQKAYDEAVDAARDKVEGITNAQSDLADQVQISQLKMIESDPNATAIEKQRARLKIQELLAKKEQRDTIATNKIAVDAAQDKLDAAKAEQARLAAQASAQKSMIDLMVEQNKLIAERNKLEAGAGGGGAAGGAKGGGGKGVPKPPGGGGGLGDLLGLDELKANVTSALDGILAPIQGKLDALKLSFSNAWAAITATLAPASEAWNNAMATVGGALERLRGAFASTAPTAQAALGLLAATFTQVLGINLPVIINNLSATIELVLGNIAAFWTQWGDEIIMVVTFTLQAIMAGIGGALSIISSIILSFTILGAGIWKAFGKLLEGDWQGAWDTISETFDTVIDTIADGLIAFFDSALSLVDMNLGEFFSIWEGTLDLLGTLVLETFTNIALSIEQGITDAIAGARELLTGFIDLGTDIIDGIIEGIEGGATALINAASGVIQDAIDAALAVLGNPHSPSPVTRKRIGEPYSQGISAGVMDGIKLIRKASLTAQSYLLAPVGAGSVSNISNSSRVENYNLSVATRETSQSVESNFYHMRARSGVR